MGSIPVNHVVRKEVKVVWIHTRHQYSLFIHSIIQKRDMKLGCELQQDD